MSSSGDQTVLLRIRAPFGAVEVRGPHEPRSGLMDGIELPEEGVLRVQASRGPLIEASYARADGALSEWDESLARGPLLFEETTYHVYIVGLDHVPRVQHRDPLLAQNVAVHREQKVAAGTFNFGRQVGLTDIEVHFGPDRVTLTLEVVPTKIDYATDYRQLHDDVESVTHGLALAFMRSTYRHAGVGTTAGAELDWIIMLRQEVNHLQQAIERINRYPFRHLTREVQEELSRKIKRPDAVARRAILRGKGTGEFDQVSGVGPVRQSVPSTAAQSTLDTPEHRWLALQLSETRNRLEVIAGVLDREAMGTGGQRSGIRRQAERAEIGHIVRSIGHMLTTPAIAAASARPQSGPPSLTLLSAPGYREAHQILTALRLALQLGGESLQYQSKDVHDLYEIWCFLRVVGIVADVTGASIATSGLIQHYRGGLRVGLRAGARSDVDVPDGRRLLTVSYNRSYPGQTGTQKPDIVVRVREEGAPDLVIVLDAKYRVDASSEYRSSFGAPGPPIEAVNALHRYRDAIVTRRSGGESFRPVVRGAALFPLTLQETSTFSNSSLFASLGSLGIGALPFLPNNTGMVEAWLTELLQLETIDLAWNGPPNPAAVL